MHTFLVSDKITLKNIKDKYRYEFGQWFSNKRAYALMEEYEQENNFKYDWVFLGRFDYLSFEDIIFSNYDNKYFYAYYSAYYSKF